MMVKKGIVLLSTTIFLLQYFCSCNSASSSENNAIATDSATIIKGKTSFTQHCSGCHDFRQEQVGPQLGGITNEVSGDWIKQFVRNPQQLSKTGDERASRLLKKYGPVMPSFSNLSDGELNAIIAFLNTKESPYQFMSKVNGKEIDNPVADSIQLSGLVADLQLITEIPASGDAGEMPRTRITKLDFEPHTGSLFIVDLRGKLYKLQNNKPLVYLDISKSKTKFINKPGLATGFGSFAFHPDFARNGLLYTTHTEAPGSANADFGYDDSINVIVQWVLTEWKTDHPGETVFSGTNRELLRADMVTGMHGVQEITFNPLSKPGDKDYGLLYIGVGDGGSIDAGYPHLTHSTEKIWGSVLRIDPSGKNSTNGKYGIPEDNPFVQDKKIKALREIYAYGFRNPHRITWSKSGQMLVSNIGHHNIESIYLVTPGDDCGWPIREGTFLIDPYGYLEKVYQLPADDSVHRVTYPVAQYDHDEGRAISGGVEYWDNAIPELEGKLLFGDISPGRLFYIETADIKSGNQATIKEWKISFNGLPTTLKDLCGGDRVALHFGRDYHGEIYLLTHSGKIYKIANATFKTPNVQLSKASKPDRSKQ